MERLLVVVLQAADADGVVDALTSEGFRVTWLRSTGGFLKKDNATILVAVSGDEAYRQVLAVIEQRSSSRDVELPPILRERLDDWKERVVHQAGAIIFVVPLEGIVRL
ncbi:MAG TPA: cyclic-di-AMP receptor [Candidatus Limnocylindrales bacterium]|nr:cyclic-di-AMP receptor [Candidatus Limnocylindrales bacterium]